MKTINCRRCSKPYPASEFNSPSRPTCKSCLKERREGRALKREEGISPHPSRILKPKLRGASGNSYKHRNFVLRHLGFATYKDYLNSDLWAGIREKVFAVKGRQCFTCGKPANQVHHNRYRLENMTGRSLKFLVPTCGTCHRGIEFKGEKKIPKSAVVAIRHKKKRKDFLAVEESEKPARRDAWLTHRELTALFDAMFRH